MWKNVKRVAVVGAVALSLMYLGGSWHMHEKINDFVERNKPVAEGYWDVGALSLVRRVNQEGAVEGYLTDGKENIELPILQNENGLQVGDVNYWWDTLTYEQKDGLVLDAWEEFNSSTKSVLAERGWGSLTLEQKAGLVESSWDELDKGAKYPLVKGELEKALDSFYRGGE